MNTAQTFHTVCTTTGRTVVYELLRKHEIMMGVEVVTYKIFSIEGEFFLGPQATALSTATLSLTSRFTEVLSGLNLRSTED